MESPCVLVKPIGGSHDFFQYSLRTNSLSEHSLSLSHSFTEDYGICFLSPRLILVSGGYNPSTGDLVPHSFLISLDSLEVEEVCPLPVPLKGLRLVSYNNEAYSLAGCSQVSTDFSMEGYCFKYSRSRNVWVRLAEMPLPCVFPGVFLQNSNIWVTGGLTKTPSIVVLDCVRIYCVLSNSWSMSEMKLLRPSYLHGCVMFPDNHVLIFGGLREEMSNRFSYWLGGEERKILPEKISMGFIDPVVVIGEKVFAFNDEMIMFQFQEEWVITEPYGSL